MRELAGALLDKLDLDDSTGIPSSALRELSRAFVPKHVDDFAALCLARLDAPSPGTRRWAMRGLPPTFRRPDHIARIAPLLRDAEPRVRDEAAIALRQCAAWHPESRDTIAALLDATKP